MMLAVIGSPVVLLIFTLDVGGLALYLRKTARPYSFAWCARFVYGAAAIRNACYLLFLFLAWIASLLLLPTLLRWNDYHLTALWGSVDLLCALAFYGLWKWTGRLIYLAALNAG